MTKANWWLLLFSADGCIAASAKRARELQHIGICLGCGSGQTDVINTYAYRIASAIVLAEVELHCFFFSFSCSLFTHTINRANRKKHLNLDWALQMEMNMKRINQSTVITFAMKMRLVLHKTICLTHTIGIDDELISETAHIMMMFFCTCQNRFFTLESEELRLWFSFRFCLLLSFFGLLVHDRGDHRNEDPLDYYLPAIYHIIHKWKNIDWITVTIHMRMDTWMVSPHVHVHHFLKVRKNHRTIESSSPCSSLTLSHWQSQTRGLAKRRSVSL